MKVPKYEETNKEEEGEEEEEENEAEGEEKEVREEQEGENGPTPPLEKDQDEAGTYYAISPVP